MRCSALLRACVVLLALAAWANTVSAAVAPTPNSVNVTNGIMRVDGKVWKIKGIAYSPVPAGENVHSLPSGDYFTPDYAYIWSRDLPLIAAAGFNTLRIYSWANTVDHSVFLDACAQYSLKVILTYYIAALPGRTDATPWSLTEQDAVVAGFASSVALLGDHPAILMWSFGNELNGDWMNYKHQFSRVGGCNWDCENYDASQAPVGSTCFNAQTCMYTGLFGWLNRAMVAARVHTTRPMTSTFADVDRLVSGNAATDKIPRFSKLLPNMDVIAIQLYRGQTFGTFFTQFAAENPSNKPLLVGEFGVDAFNDPCGWQENGNMQPCRNFHGDNNILGGGSEDTGPSFVGCTSLESCRVPGVTTQKTWGVSLTNEIQLASSTLGGVIMEWHDENWKAIDTQDKCFTSCQNQPSPSGVGKATLAECTTPGTALYNSYFVNGAAGCTWKAHISCSNYDMSQHDLCGYWLESAPDRYVNEAWFGLNAAMDCGAAYTDMYGGHKLTVLTPRPVLAALTEYFNPGGAPVATPVNPTCESMAACYNCVKQYSDIEAHTADNVAQGLCNTQCGLQLSATPGGGGGAASTGTNNSGGGDKASTAPNGDGLPNTAASSSAGTVSSRRSSTGVAADGTQDLNGAAASTTGAAPIMMILLLAAAARMM